MADPTLEELQQQVEELRSLITTEYEPPEGSEYSYPVVNQPMNDEMWAHLAKAWGSGVISYGGAPYRIGNVNDVDNTLTVYAADDEGRESGAVLEGFAHRMTGNVTVNVPAVTSVTDYVIGLQYDPTRAGNPIQLSAFTRPLATSLGRKYIPIWEGRRNPSSVLSSVKWSTARSRIAPTTTVASAEALPDPRHSGLMWGTLCWTYREREWWQLQWATESGGEMTWQNISRRRWETVGYGATYAYPGHGSLKAICREGSRRYLRGRWKRANDGNFSAPSPNGYLLWTLAPEDRPTSEERRVVSGYNLASPSWGVVNISASDGEVRFHPATNTSWVDIGELSFEAVGNA